MVARRARRGFLEGQSLRKSQFRSNDRGMDMLSSREIERERERERESCPDGCSSVGKVAQYRPGGHGFNPYIPQWHLLN